MKILQINSVCGIGSTGRIATDLHAILVAQGHQSMVAFGRDAEKNCKQTVRIGSRVDNYLHVALTRFFDAHGFGSMTATKAFIAKIRELNPDVIHLHNLHGYYLHIGLLFEYLKQANKPIIWTLHDCWAFTGHCVYFDLVGCNRWKSECHDCPLTARYPKSFGIDRSRCNYRQKKSLFTGLTMLTIVTPSQWLAGLVQQSFLGEYPVTVINNGIDLSVFRSTPSDFRSLYKLDKYFILLGVATIWDERKGYGFFLELAMQLKSDEKLVLVGLSEKQLKSLPSNIIGIARTTSTTELAEIYSVADLFVNPTLEDNFPTTNLEALACGTPVLTFGSGGSPECLGEGCGLVVTRGDLPGLVEAIAMIKRVGKASYNAACRKRAEELYDKDARFAEYIHLYENYLSSGSYFGENDNAHLEDQDGRV